MLRNLLIFLLILPSLALSLFACKTLSTSPQSINKENKVTTLAKTTLAKQASQPKAVLPTAKVVIKQKQKIKTVTTLLQAATVLIKPQIINPELVSLELVSLELVSLELVSLELVSLEPVSLEPVSPELVSPEPVSPEPVSPELVNLELVSLELFNPELVSLELVNLELVNLELVSPELVSPELVSPEPVVINDVWTRFRNGMQLPDVDNKRIKAQRNWYVKHKDYLQRVMLRAKPLLPFILDEIDKRNLPTEYALLPIVESAFQTYAYSHGRASGIWQIIPSTGRYLGLKQNWWYDGRRDLFLSTKAALKYLDILAKQFKGNPVLALASYNAGPGKIRSAIRYNKKRKRPTDFWHLTKIRKETKDYVPKLYALKQIFSHPEKYGISLLDIADKPGFEVVNIEKQIDISKAAELAQISLNDFYLLNPAFNHWATPPKGKHQLLLPVGKKALFEQNYAQLPASEHIKWVRHKIKNGETLSQIAVNYNTRIKLIKSVNKIKTHQIRAGKHLMIPTSTKSLRNYGKSNASRLAKTQSTVRGKNKTLHIVKKGESLWTISRHHGVSHKSLAKWNGMAPIDTLKFGQKLVIWNSKKSKNGTAVKLSLVSFKAPQKRMRKLNYTVRQGDSLARIADKFKLRINDIKKWNTLGKYIQPGQKIKLWIDVTTQFI